MKDQVAYPEWTNVKAAMPPADDGVKLIVASSWYDAGSHMVLAYCRNRYNEIGFYDEYGQEVRCMTHWMIAPSRPAIEPGDTYEEEEEEEED